MTAATLWFVLGLVLLVAELATGTFYLLMLAVAFAAGGVVALAGGPLALQLVLAAAIGFAGSIWLRRVRALRSARGSAHDPVQHMDVGQTVHVDEWGRDGTARAQYRGALWEVELARGEPARAGAYTIQAIHANRLVVVARNH
ncbi:MAG: NfeD family protein [Betaproteobacteria bacterium]